MGNFNTAMRSVRSFKQKLPYIRNGSYRLYPQRFRGNRRKKKKKKSEEFLHYF